LSAAEEEPLYGYPCRNCGRRGHKIAECKQPCGKCGSPDHKATRCKEPPTTNGAPKPLAVDIAPAPAPEEPQATAAPEPPASEPAPDDEDARLVALLLEDGYSVEFRSQVWWEVHVTRADEVWHGTGSSKGAALRRAVDKMFASHFARILLRAELGQPEAAPSSSPEEPARTP
jgi:hypothetical protein